MILNPPTTGQLLLASVPKQYREPPYYCEFVARVYEHTGQQFVESWIRSKDAEKAGAEINAVLARKKKLSRAYIVVYRELEVGAELVGTRHLNVAKMNKMEVNL